MENLERPWNGTLLPTDPADIALLIAATRVTVHNGCKASFWTSNWLHGQPPLAYSLASTNTIKERTE